MSPIPVCKSAHRHIIPRQHYTLLRGKGLFRLIPLQPRLVPHSLFKNSPRTLWGCEINYPTPLRPRHNRVCGSMLWTTVESIWMFPKWMRIDCLLDHPCPLGRYRTTKIVGSHQPFLRSPLNRLPGVLHLIPCRLLLHNNQLW